MISIETDAGFAAALGGRARGAARRLALLWIFAVAWFGATAWVRPLAMPDEGRYLTAAWEMLVRGDWLVPTLDGLPFFHKPPLFYWLAHAAMRVAGPSAFAGRLPSVFAAATLACAMTACARAWLGERHARLLFVVLATTPYLYLGGQYANMDMLVAACISGAVLCAAHGVLRMLQGRPAGIPIQGAYALAGLGVLAKGLIGVVLPGAIVVVWLLAARRTALLRRMFPPSGIALFLALVLPWMAAMQARYPGFLDYFIVEQHFRRFAGTGFNNVEAWWFYLPVLGVLTLPWSLALPAILKKPFRAPEPAAMLRLLMACWIVVVIVFFSIPQSKLIGYALPAVAPLAWLLADAIASSERSFMHRHALTIAGVSSVVLAAAVVLYAARAPHSSRAIAVALMAQRAPGETVQFLNAYPYDLEFEARLKPPIAVVDEWRNEAVFGPDSWQKEFLDEARFAPGDADARLVERIARPGNARTWIVAPARETLPEDLQGRVVAQTTELKLWLVEPAEAK